MTGYRDSFSEAVDEFADFMGGIQPRQQSWVAYTGDGFGHVSGSDSTHILCRFYNQQNIAVEVLNLVATFAEDVRIIVGFAPEYPDVVQVLRIADPRLDNPGGPDATVSPSTGIGLVVAHGWQHAWLGGDTTYAHLRQLSTLRIYPVSGFVVGISQGVLPRSGTPGINIPDNTAFVDLTSHVPGSGAQYSLISLDSSGAVAVTDGAAVASTAVLALTDIPATPVGNFRLAAIRLYAGQTTIQESRTATDVVDLRWPQEAAAAPVDELSANAILATQIFGG